MVTEQNMTPRELAQREHVPLQTVYSWNSTGDGPRFMKIGRHVRYRLRDVEAWETARYVDHGQPGGDAA
jgi:predicted DNA-binding transcriptional regulator AlpA